MRGPSAQARPRHSAGYPLVRPMPALRNRRRDVARPARQEGKGEAVPGPTAGEGNKAHRRAKPPAAASPVPCLAGTGFAFPHRVPRRRPALRPGATPGGTPAGPGPGLGLASWARLLQAQKAKAGPRHGTLRANTTGGGRGVADHNPRGRMTSLVARDTLCHAAGRPRAVPTTTGGGVAASTTTGGDCPPGTILAPCGGGRWRALRVVRGPGPVVLVVLVASARVVWSAAPVPPARPVLGPVAPAPSVALPPRAAALARAALRLSWAVGPALAGRVRADVPPADQPRDVRRAARLLFALWAAECAR